jgi:hypothetical protein
MSKKQKIIYTSFSENYFKDIWGTVHRHDYCNDLANNLIERYHPKSLLDIGTGCGYLVKTLREKGVDAWGTEISEYALQNSCAPGYVVYGDIRNLPFKDDKFEVIHSQGVWEYIPEDEVEATFKECLRVGRIQHHNLDTLEGYNAPEHKKITIKPRAWWDAKRIGVGFDTSKILVSCPVHQVKEYSFQRWIDNVKSFTYPNYEIFVVDNSPNMELVNKYKDQIPIVHIKVDQSEPYNRITHSMEVIRQHFLKGNYSRWFNLECDVIPGTDIIEVLLKYGKDADWIGHAYPNRGGDIEESSGIGCSMLSRRLVENYNYDEADRESPDVWLWEQVRRAKKYKTVEIWGHVPINHLDK